VVCSGRSSPSPESRKYQLTPYQKILLRREYRKSAYITPEDAKRLAGDLKLPVAHVEVLFRRMRQSEMKSMNQEAEPSAVVPSAGSRPSTTKKRSTGKSQPGISPLSVWQVAILRKKYRQDPKLTKERLAGLCDKVGAAERAIVSWFREQSSGNRK